MGHGILTPPWIPLTLPWSLRLTRELLNGTLVSRPTSGIHSCTDFSPRIPESTESMYIHFGIIARSNQVC